MSRFLYVSPLRKDVALPLFPYVSPNRGDVALPLFPYVSPNRGDVFAEDREVK